MMRSASKWSPHLYITELLLGMMLSIFFDPTKLPLSIKALIIGATSFFIPYICYHDPHHCLSIWPLTHLYEALSIRDAPAMALVLGFVLAACMVVYIAVCYVFTKFITLKYERNATDYKIMTVGAAIGVFAFVFYFLVFTPFLSAGGGVALPPSAGAGIGLAEGGRTPGQEEATTPDEEDIDPFDKDKDGKLDKKERKHKEKEERKKHKERQSSDPPTQTHPAPPQHPQQTSSGMLRWLRALKKSYLDFAVNNPTIYYGCWVVIMGTCIGCAYLIWKENMIPHHVAPTITGGATQPPMAQLPGSGVAQQQPAFAFPAYIQETVELNDQKLRQDGSELSADEGSETTSRIQKSARQSTPHSASVASRQRLSVHSLKGGPSDQSLLSPPVLVTRATSPSLRRRHEPNGRLEGSLHSRSFQQIEEGLSTNGGATPKQIWENGVTVEAHGTPYSSPRKPNKLRRRVHKKTRGRKRSVVDSVSEDSLSSASTESDEQCVAEIQQANGHGYHRRLSRSSEGGHRSSLGLCESRQSSTGLMGKEDDSKDQLTGDEKEKIREGVRGVIKDSINAELGARFWQERKRTFHEEMYEREHTKYKNLKQTFAKRIQEAEEHISAVQKSEEARFLSLRKQLYDEKEEEGEKLKRALEASHTQNEEITRHYNEASAELTLLKQSLREERKVSDECKIIADAERRHSEDLARRLRKHDEEREKINEAVKLKQPQDHQETLLLKEEMRKTLCKLEEGRTKIIELQRTVEEERQQGEEWRAKLEAEAVKVKQLEAENKIERKKNQALALQVEEMSNKMTEILTNVTHLNTKEASPGGAPPRERRLSQETGLLAKKGNTKKEITLTPKPSKTKNGHARTSPDGVSEGKQAGPAEEAAHTEAPAIREKTSGLTPDAPHHSTEPNTPASHRVGADPTSSLTPPREGDQKRGRAPRRSATPTPKPSSPLSSFTSASSSSSALPIPPLLTTTTLSAEHDRSSASSS